MTEEKKEIVIFDRSKIPAREDWLDALAIIPKDYNMELTKEEEVKLVRQMRLLRTGIAAVVPLICPGGDNCPYRSQCPFVDLQKTPLGKQCLVEKDLLIYHAGKYAESYNVGPEDYLDQQLVKELAEIDLYEWRVGILLATEYRDLQVDVVGAVNPATGDVFYNRQVAPVLDLKFKLKTKRMKIHEALVGTRKEQYKREAALKQSQNPDVAKSLSELKKRVLSIESKTREDIEDAEYEEIK